MRVAIVAPHIFMQDQLLSRVIFSPGDLAVALADELVGQGINVTLASPGPVTTKARNLTADLTLFQTELDGRGDDYMSLLKKHPLTFITLARQVQAELLTNVIQNANAGKYDLVHVYMNEEELGLSLRKLCNKPIVFTHHDPFNFSVKYKAIMPKHADANWLSISRSQRRTMAARTNWIANIYHGIQPDTYQPVKNPSLDYVAYIGRIIEPKGVHLAIQAVQEHNRAHNAKLKLKIAGKHYSGAKDSYWQTLQPLIDGKVIEYVGYISEPAEKNTFLGNAAGLLVPSTFEEPFGMVMIEALACGTPIIGLDSGAIPEVVKNDQTGFVVPKVLHGETLDETKTVNALAEVIAKLNIIDRSACRKDFEDRFTLHRMATEHIKAYRKLLATK